MPKLKTLIDQHRRYYERSERQGFETARRLYIGDAWGSGTAGGVTTDVDRRMFASKAVIYAIADTAMSSLISPAPRAAPMPTNPKSKTAIPAVSGLMDWVFRSNKMRRRASTTLIDAVLCKRGIFKTGWDAAKGRPIIRAVDPQSLFFDLTVRDVDDIGYWLEATVVPWTTFAEKRDAGEYDSAKIKDVKPDRYPRWLLDSNWTQQQTGVLDTQRYVTIWEYYDAIRGRSTQYVENNDVTLFEDTISYMPYSMYSLNPSGVDCTGISEVQLLLNPQQTINDLLTLWKRIVYLMVPRTFYDAGRISDEKIGDAMRAPVGSYIPLHPRASMSPDARFSNLFFDAPVPQVPVGVKEMIAKTEDDMAFTSALAEAARGRISGARTATEMMIMDAYNQTRLAARSGNLNEAIEDVAKKAFYLCRRHLPKPQMVRIMGGNFVEVSVDTLDGIDMDFEMVAYNALRKNPAVVLDTLVQMLPIFANAPNVVMPDFIETLADLFMLPGERFLLSKEQMAEMEAQAKAEAEAQAAAASGAAPTAGAAPAAGWDKVRQLMAQAQAPAAAQPAGPDGTGVAPPANLAEIQAMRGEPATAPRAQNLE